MEGERPAFDAVPVPHRNVDAKSCATLDVRGGTAIEIKYQSLSEARPAPTWRMSPHAFAYDGFRWHVRAFCHLDQKFKTSSRRDPAARGSEAPSVRGDAVWNEFVNVGLKPNPDLSPTRSFSRRLANLDIPEPKRSRSSIRSRELKEVEEARRRADASEGSAPRRDKAKQHGGSNEFARQNRIPFDDAHRTRVEGTTSSATGAKRRRC